MVFFTTTLLLSISCSNARNDNTTENNEKKEDAEKSVKAIHITRAYFLDKIWDFENSPNKWVYKGDKPCIIDFYADWCGPCKIAGPILEELANEYKDQIYVYKVNTEEERELSATFGIRSIPAFLCCPQNGEPQMASGIARSNEDTKKMFKQMIEEILLGNK
jgi:thioredoxin